MKKKIGFGGILGMILLLAIGCAGKEPGQHAETHQKEEQIQIGMCFDTFVLERWLRDRNVFVSTANDLGAQVNVQNANGDSVQQCKQVEYLIEKQVDAIVIVAVDTGDERLKDLLCSAKEAGIVVVSYDRLIQNANTDLYVSFDNVQVGTLMAEAVLSQIPENGKVAAIYGPDTDDNVSKVISGVEEVLNRHDQTLVYQNKARGWIEEYGFEYTNECLKQVGAVDAIICGNDALAAAAISALAENQLAGEVCIVGQDADIQACQRIVEGYQYMTVYKPIQNLAKQAAQYTVQLIQGKEIDVNEEMNDGTYDVPFCKLEPIAVTMENIDEVIVDSQFHFKDEVYLHVDE